MSEKIVDHHGQAIDTEVLDTSIEVTPVEETFSLLKLDNDKDLSSALMTVENALKFVDKLRDFCLARSKPNDWTNQNGNPYFGEAGCNRFAAPFQIYEKPPIGKEKIECWIIDEDGNRKSVDDRKPFEGNIRFIFFNGTIGSKILGIEASFEGGSKLNDGFKSKDDILFYLQKAKANWRGRGFRKLLGMENLTWEELEKVGIKQNAVKAIERTVTAKAESAEATELWNILLDLAGGDVKAAEDILFKKTNTDKYKGKTRPTQLTANTMAWILPHFKAELAKKTGGTAKEPAAANSKKPDVADGGTGNGKPESYDDTLMSLTSKLTQDEIDGVLQVFRVMKVSEITNGQREPFLAQLKKRVALKEKK